MNKLYQDMSEEEKIELWKRKIKISVSKGQEKESKIQDFIFKCRLCGHTKYEGVYNDSSLVSLGGRKYPIAYRCSGCSVIFKDFVKFSVKE